MTAVPCSSVTYEREPATDTVKSIDRAGVARANVAISSEVPEGTVDWSKKHEQNVRNVHSEDITMGS